VVALVCVLVWGGWPPALYGKIISILGIVAIGGLVLVGISQVGILLGGPVGRFKAAVDKSGASVEGSGVGEPLPPIIAGAAAGAAAGASAAAKATAPTEGDAV
jgi:hypothetical protein